MLTIEDWGMLIGKKVKFFGNKNYTFMLKGVDEREKYPLFSDDNKHSKESCKPLMRRPSQLTEDEAKIIVERWDGNKVMDIQHTGEGYIAWIDLTGRRKIFEYSAPQIGIYMIQLGIDIMGWIEQGLAIEERI